MGKYALTFTILFTFGFSTVVWAQCAPPSQLLCGQEPATNVPQFVPSQVSYDCVTGPFTSIFDFATNVDPARNNVTIRVTGVTCDPVGTIPNLSAIVVESVAGGECDGNYPADASPCDTYNGDFTINLSGLAPETYYAILISSDVELCSFDIAVSGNAVSINAFGDTQIPLGASTTFEVNGGSENYLWTPSIGLDDQASSTPVFTGSDGDLVGQSVTFNVQSFNNINGCQMIDSVLVEIGPPIRPAKVLTPNGDGLTDTWKIKGLDDDDFSSAIITVYNRWGQVVFKSTGYTKEWDGTNNGKELPAATYYYVIELNNIEIKSVPYTGNVAIVK